VEGGVVTDNFTAAPPAQVRHQPMYSCFSHARGLCV
jgi:hypothetical protein